MTEPSRWRPEQAMRLGLLFLAVGTLLMLGLILMTALADSGSTVVTVVIPVALALLVAAVFFLIYSRTLRRRQRPEWLETQAWRQGLQDKLREKQPPDAGGPTGGSP